MKRKDVDVFSVRDLRVRSGDLVKDAEAGRLSMITKYGKPRVIGVPFDRRLIELGVDKDLALSLFERGLVTLAKAAKIADMTLDQFMDLLAQTSVVAVDYPTSDLAREMKIKI